MEVEKNDFSVLPFRLIIKILNKYYIVNPINFIKKDPAKLWKMKLQLRIYHIWESVDLLDFFGYFKNDMFRKCFPIFTSVFPECEVHASISRKIPFRRLYHYSEKLQPGSRSSVVPASLSRRITEDELFSMLSQSVFLKSIEKRCMFTTIPKGLMKLKYLKRVKLFCMNSMGDVGEKRYRGSIHIFNSLPELKTLYIHMYPSNNRRYLHRQMIEWVNEEEEEEEIEKTKKTKEVVVKKTTPRPLEFTPKLTNLCLLGGYYCKNFLFSRTVQSSLKRLILKDVLINQSMINCLSENFPKLTWIELEQFLIPEEGSITQEQKELDSCDDHLFDLTPLFYITNLRFLFLSTSETDSLIKIWNNLRFSTTRRCDVEVLSIRASKHPRVDLVEHLVPLITPHLKFFFLSTEDGHFTFRRNGCELQFKKDRLLKKIVAIPETLQESYTFSCNGDYFPRSIVEAFLKYRDVFKFDSFELMDTQILSPSDLEIFSLLPISQLSFFECEFNEELFEHLHRFSPTIEFLEMDRCIFPSVEQYPYDDYERLLQRRNELYMLPKLKKLRISINNYRLGAGHLAVVLIPRLSPSVVLSFDYLNFSLLPEKAREAYSISLSNYSSSNMPGEEIVLIHKILETIVSKAPSVEKEVKSVVMNRSTLDHDIVGKIFQLKHVTKFMMTGCTIAAPLKISRWVENLEVFSFHGGDVLDVVVEEGTSFSCLKKLRVLKFIIWKKKKLIEFVKKLGKDVCGNREMYPCLEEFHVMSPSSTIVEMFKEDRKTVVVVVLQGFNRERRYIGGERIKKME